MAYGIILRFLRQTDVKFLGFIAPMGARKPRLDWIRQVLVDLEDTGDIAEQAPLTLHEQSGLVSIGPQTTDDTCYALNGDDPLLCPSWQLMRLTAASRA
jgi:hypothetical protein